MTQRFGPTAFSLIAVGAVLLSVRTLAQTPNPDVLKATQQFSDCWDSKNTACMEKMLTDEVVMVPRLARLLNKSTFIAEFKAGRFGTNSDPHNIAQVPDLRIRTFGSTAIVTYTQSSPCCSATATNAVPHYTTLVWVKSNASGWQLASYHVSVNPMSVVSGK